MVRMLVGVLFVPGLLFGQEADTERWNLKPTVALVKFLPGKDIVVECPDCYNAASSTYRFAGTGLAFNIRASHRDLPGIAVTIGTGVNWFYSTEDEIIGYSSSVSGGVGSTLKRQSFETYPVNAGIQFCFPKESVDAIMAFLGVEGSVHLVDGDVSVADQTKTGYAFLGGFAFKVFEMGVRYSAFSDLKNLGVHFGLRLPAVQL
jgi:hypothetical protein